MPTCCWSLRTNDLIFSLSEKASRMTQPNLFARLDQDFDPQSCTIAPSQFPQARETSALAAVENLPRRANQNTRILALITAAGETGISDLELQRCTGFLRSTICARRGDLASFITAADSRYHPTDRTQTYTRWRRVSA